MAGSDYDKVSEILLMNADRPFVQRIFSPDKFPTLKNEDGTVSTHSMAWGTDDNGNALVYPTVVISKDKAVRLDDQKAWDRAVKTGDFIKFNDPKEADWFSKNYKVFWGNNGGQ